MNATRSEIWRDVVGSDGFYQVSSLGRVRSKTRYCVRSGNRKYLVHGKILKQHKNSTGYFRVPLLINGAKVNAFVHRLVAEAFIENPFNFDTVNHKDFNPNNNNVENLEWTSRIGNYRYSFDSGRFNRTIQWKSALKKSLDKTMGKPVIGLNLADGSELRYRALNDCAKDGFQPSCVSCCCNGKRQTHKGYVWRFAPKEEENAQ